MDKKSYRTAECCFNCDYSVWDNWLGGLFCNRSGELKEVRETENVLILNDFALEHGVSEYAVCNEFKIDGFKMEKE